MLRKVNKIRHDMGNSDSIWEETWDWHNTLSCSNLFHLHHFIRVKWLSMSWSWNMKRWWVYQKTPKSLPASGGAVIFGEPSMWHQRVNPKPRWDADVAPNFDVVFGCFLIAGQCGGWDFWRRFLLVRFFVDGKGKSLFRRLTSIAW